MAQSSDLALHISGLWVCVNLVVDLLLFSIKDFILITSSQTTWEQYQNKYRECIVSFTAGYRDYSQTSAYFPDWIHNHGE